MLSGVEVDDGEDSLPQGKAGVDVPVAVLQGIEIRDIVVRSGDRNQYFSINPRK